MSSILIFSPIMSRRLSYIATELFDRILGLETIITSNKEEYLQSQLPKINYSYTPLATKEIYIIPQGLLFEQGLNSSQSTILPLSPPIGDAYTSYCPPIEKEAERVILSEDILATSFFLLSRYEEYLPFQSDEHGRFSAKNSIAFRQGFLRRPIINEWAIELGNILKQNFPSIEIKPNSYQSLFTYDVDMAFKYKEKGLLRNIGAFLTNQEMNKERIQVLTDKSKDPFDTFDEINKWHEKQPNQVHFFILLGDWSKFDKNIHYKNGQFQQILKKLSQKFKIGIHPSYKTNEHDAVKAQQQLQKEVERLEQIIEKKIDSSRQHFLKLRFPDTYQRLIKLGITKDYSMGYSDEIGFRASITTPFFWYDLLNETKTNLEIFPFQVMDITLKNYLNLNPEKALKETLLLKSHCQNVGGTFCTLWHNSSFDEEWKDWKMMYKTLIEE